MGQAEGPFSYPSRYATVQEEEQGQRNKKEPFHLWTIFSTLPVQ